MLLGVLVLFIRLVLFGLVLVFGVGVGGMVGDVVGVMGFLLVVVSGVVVIMVFFVSSVVVCVM